MNEGVSGNGREREWGGRNGGRRIVGAGDLGREGDTIRGEEGKDKESKGGGRR